MIIVITNPIQPYVHGRIGFNPGISRLPCGPISRIPSLAESFENKTRREPIIKKTANAVIKGIK
jgi:hypothetical protein